MKPYEKYVTEMADESLDNPEKEWCYLAKSTTVIGVPFQPDVTQVTYDGALFTKYAELSFFYGKDKKPVMARQKTFLEGWIPVVQYDWTEEGIRYGLEMFSARLDGENESNTINFVRAEIRNVSESPKKGCFAAAMKNTGKDGRFQGLDFATAQAVEPVIPMEFDENWTYEMNENQAVRGGKLVYTYDLCTEKEAAAGKAYTGIFRGKDLGVTETMSVCFAYSEKELAPGERMECVFKMPRVPVALKDAEEKNSAFVEKIMRADYAEYRQKTVTFWKEIAENGASFSIPEKRVQNTIYASFVYLLLSTRTKDGEKTQTDGLPYPDFFLTSLPQIGLGYLSMGHPEYLKPCIRKAITQQEESGLYFDRSLAHGGIIPAAHGHIMYIAGMYCIICRDFEMAREIYPSLEKAVRYIEKSIEEDEYGLLPPAYPYDNEMIDGHYTSNNLWALLGLRFCIRVARMLGKDQDEAEWTALEKVYSENILRGVEASVHEDGYVPTGLYEFKTGKQARRGFDEYRTNSDWENMLLSYPTELLGTEDRRLKGTLDKVRETYAEGIMTYRHGMQLHQYITANMIEQYMVMGDSYTALKDYYHLILHSGSTYECFETLVKPWADRMVDQLCPPPHGWASAKSLFLTRNLLVQEFGGRAGMVPGERNLHLFPVLSPEWAKPGETVSFKNVLTEMGKLSSSITFSENGAEISIESEFTEKPGAIKIRVPYFKELSGIETDAATSDIQDGWIVVSPDASRVRLTWREKPGAHDGTFTDILSGYRSSYSFEGVDENYCPIMKAGTPFLTEEEKQAEPHPLSFEMVRKTYCHEYARRRKEFTETSSI